MKRSLCGSLIAAVLLVPTITLAQPSQGTKELVGIWMFRGFLAGPAQPPVYVGTARFLTKGNVIGLPTDQHTGAPIGEWIRTGNQEFAFTFVADTYDNFGNFANTHRVRGKLTLSEDGLSATGKVLLEFLDSAGNVTFTAPAPTSFTGTRVVVLPLPL